jgi:hypothetical protein
MADRGAVNFLPGQDATLVSGHEPLMAGGGGGEPVDPKRHVLVAGEWVPIQ